MNMLARLIPQPQPEMAQVPDGWPLDLDRDFEEACARSLQEPMQTPTERLREAQENILIVLRDKDEAHDKRISELEQALAEERGHKAANLEEIANVERSHAALNDHQPIPSSSKRKKGREAAPV